MFNINKKTEINEKGQTVLVLVLLTALIGILSILLTQQLGRRQQRQLSQIEQIDTTYYATEGALYETLEHLIGDSSWPSSSPYTDTYTLNGVEITRTIEVSTSGGEEVRTVDILGNLNGISRRVTGEDIILSSASSKRPLDLILALDLSGSMWDADIGGTWQPIGSTKTAAQFFIDLLDPSTDRVGLFGWGSNCQNIFPEVNPSPYDYTDCINDWQYAELEADSPSSYPSGHFQFIKDRIGDINDEFFRGIDPLIGPPGDDEGGTNMDNAIRVVTEYIDQKEAVSPPADSDTVVAQILLSDGLTNNPIYCCTSAGNAPALPGAMGICEWRQAESAHTTQGSWTQATVTDTDAGVDRTYVSPNTAASTNRKTYRVTIPSDGVYEALAWKYSADNTQNTFNISFRNLANNRIVGPELWNQNVYGKWNLQADNRPFELRAGDYEFTVEANSPNHRLDQFIIQPACGKEAAITQAINATSTVISGTGQTGIPIYTIGLG
ncbi:VWA domain-containing protein, partial [candidate division WWE3 bacterium]|nr:VWA domain-containing protein [candidate division WWE3 bacterium]